MADLLLAPRLNSRQVALDAALRETLNLREIIYKYPLSGDFRSPFVFHDLTGNGVEDAIVFYAHAETPDSVRFKVMSEREDGSWYAVQDSPSSGEADQIDFVRFTNILDTQSSNMVIGWRSSARGEAHLGVYTYTESGFRREISHPYSLWNIHGYGEELDKITVVSEHVGEARQLSLIGRGLGGGVTVLDSVQLPRGRVLQMLSTNPEESFSAVFLDLLSDVSDGGAQYIATSIVRVNDGNLEVITGNDSLDLFSETMREYHHATPFYSIRFGHPSIHALIPIPQDNRAVGEEIPLTDLIYLDSEESFSLFSTAAINHDDGYILIFPEKWIDNVTVLVMPEYREWRFFAISYDGGQGDELLRIQTLPAGDFRDIFAQYTLIGQRGHLNYYAYISTREEGDRNPLAIEFQELGTMFRLL